jgi:hypothetical protein
MRLVSVSDQSEEQFCASPQSVGTLVSFDIVSFFTNVQVSEALQVISSKLHNDDTLQPL